MGNHRFVRLLPSLLLFPIIFLVFFADLPAKPVAPREQFRQRSKLIKDIDNKISDKIRKREFIEAIPLARELVKLSPGKEMSRFTLARLLIYANPPARDDYYHNQKEAVTILLASSRLYEAASMHRDAALRHYFLGMAFWRAGDRNGAYNHFQQSYKLDAGLIYSLYNMGALMDEMGNYPRAADHFINFFQKSGNQIP